MLSNPHVARAAAALAGLVLLGAGTHVAHATDDERLVISPDPAADVAADDDESPRLVAATDVTQVEYRAEEAPAHDEPGYAVKIRIIHGMTLTGSGRHHRAITTFTHAGTDYRLTSTRRTAALRELRGGTWERAHPEWIARGGSDGRLVAKFPVSVLGAAHVLEDLRTRLVVAGTSIVDRTATDEELHVYPPR